MKNKNNTQTRDAGHMQCSNERLDEFKREIEETEVLTQPLISEGFPFETLMIEYESASPNFIEKLAVLSADFKRYRKSRGDGNCFFRSFAFRLFEELCIDESFMGKIEVFKQIWASILEQAKFDKIAYEDFLEESFKFMNEFQEQVPVLKAAEIDPCEWLANDWRSNDIKSNTMVIVLRMITSAYLQLHADDFLPFLYDFSTQPSMSEYCRRHVEAMGVESDQIDIIALTNLFNCQIEIAYLDASSDLSNMIMKFGDANGSILRNPITLLYRPGHYDILYRQ